MAVIRWHLARKGLGLFNDLQNESSVVGNLVFPLMFRDFATPHQMEKYMPGIMDGRVKIMFGERREKGKR
jgi:acyl-CoA dehydrogenase